MLYRFKVYCAGRSLAFAITMGLSILLSLKPANAQITWNKVANRALSQESNYRLVQTDLSRLSKFARSAPDESNLTAEGLAINIPKPDGS